MSREEGEVAISATTQHTHNLTVWHRDIKIFLPSFLKNIPCWEFYQLSETGILCLAFSAHRPKGIMENKIKDTAVFFSLQRIAWLSCAAQGYVTILSVQVSDSCSFKIPVEELGYKAALYLKEHIFKIPIVK